MSQFMTQPIPHIFFILFFLKIYLSLPSPCCCSLFIPYKRVDIAVYLAFLCLNWVEQGGMKLAYGLTEHLPLFCYLRAKKP